MIFFFKNLRLQIRFELVAGSNCDFGLRFWRVSLASDFVLFLSTLLIENSYFKKNCVGNRTTKKCIVKFRNQ